MKPFIVKAFNQQKPASTIREAETIAWMLCNEITTYSVPSEMRWAAIYKTTPAGQFVEMIVNVNNKFCWFRSALRQFDVCKETGRPFSLF